MAVTDLRCPCGTTHEATAYYEYCDGCGTWWLFTGLRWTRCADPTPRLQHAIAEGVASLLCGPPGAMQAVVARAVRPLIDEAVEQNRADWQALIEAAQAWR